MSANPPGETREETVSQGGGVIALLSGGDERSEPESQISSALHVDLHGRVEGAGAERGEAAPAPPLPCLFKTSAPESNQQVAPARLPSPVAKRAETLRLNLEDLIKRRGLEHIGFCTLTFVENLCCRVKAGRRFHSLNTHFFSQVPEYEGIWVPERQERGAIHFHGAIALPWDISDGFDFENLLRANLASQRGDSVERRKIERESNWFNACPALRAWWHDLAAAARRYHFGRCETFPIYSTGQACAFYMGAYVGKQFRARAPEDKGMRTVRYSLKHRPVTVNWMWANGRGLVWRRGCRGLAMALRLDDLDQLGEKWQWRYRKQITWLGECDAVPYFIRQENGEFSTFDEDWRSLWQWWRTDARNSSG
jgi:hypothetical protein